MISHAKISRQRRMFKTLTGLSTEGFKQILPSFEEAWEADLDHRDARHIGRGWSKMSWDKSLPLGPVFALDTLRNRVSTILKNNQNRNNTQQGDYLILLSRIKNYV